MINPNMNMMGKIGFPGGPIGGLGPVNQVRLNASPPIGSGLCQTCFSNYHQHGDGTYGYDLMKISPITGKIVGCFEDRIEQRKW